MGDGRSYFKLGTNVSEFISTLSAGGGKGPIVQGSREGEGEGVSSTMAPHKCWSRQGLRRVGVGVFITAGLLNSGVQPGWGWTRGFSTHTKPPVRALGSLASVGHPGEGAVGGIPIPWLSQELQGLFPGSQHSSDSPGSCWPLLSAPFLPGSWGRGERGCRCIGTLPGE